MKKNKMMRVASVLLIAVLLTTCVISGTFAKYITSDSAKDTARVAKFGVVATISGDLFGPTYLGKAQGNKITTYGVNTETVSASTNTDVVAPGTTGDKMTFSVTGTPEVSTKVTFAGYQADGATNLKYYAAEPQLVAGSYGVMVAYTGELTKESTNGKWKSTDNATFTAVASGGEEPAANATYYELQDATGALSAAYFPITWSYATGTTSLGTVTKTNSLNSAITGIAAAFQSSGADATFAPNKDNALIASLTWDWFFEGGLNDTAEGSANSNSLYSDQDKADTILGDMIAATAGTGKLAGNAYVVALSGDDYKAVKTTEVSIMSDSAADNKVTVAYIASTAPTAAYTAELTTLSADVIAVLGVAFDASLTVVQVD